MKIYCMSIILPFLCIAKVAFLSVCLLAVACQLVSLSTNLNQSIMHSVLGRVKWLL